MQSLKHIILILTSLFLCACHTEQTIPVEIDVALHIKNDNHTSPVYVTIENNTKSASNYLWTFEGGEPATSTKKEPGVVTFTTPGEHTITLEAWNDGDRQIKSYTVMVNSAVTTDFLAEADVNNYAPAKYKITNLSTGGISYKWTFEGGYPATFDGEQPPVVTYALAGKYTITLSVDNGGEIFTISRQVEVRESLDASFAIIPSFEDEDDMEAPVRAAFVSQLQGVETFEWECLGGATITNKASKDASILFPREGVYTVYLNVSNGKETKRVSKNITVKSNTNLRTHNNIKFGINTAQESIGSYYSTKLRRKFKSSEINTSNGSLIDIVFYGFNEQFTRNSFVSPDALSETPLVELPDAGFTKFINSQEVGNILLSPTEFDSMKNDSLLKNLPIKGQMYGNELFTDTPLPRVVLFETGDGRKGAILVKELVRSGKSGSYIIADIKVQKND